MSGSKTFGEIDIDSDLEAIFHEGDQEILEKCAAILAKLFWSTDRFAKITFPDILFDKKFFYHFFLKQGTNLLVTYT